MLMLQTPESLDALAVFYSPQEAHFVPGKLRFRVHHGSNVGGPTRCKIPGFESRKKSLNTNFIVEILIDRSVLQEMVKSQTT